MIRSFLVLMDVQLWFRRRYFLNFIIDMIENGGQLMMDQDYKIHVASIILHRLKKEMKWRGMLWARPATTRPGFEFVQLTPKGIAYLQELRCRDRAQEWATHQTQ